jgi:hypothetical protein
MTTPTPDAKEKAYAAIVHEITQGGGTVYEVKAGMPYIGAVQLSKDGLFSIQRQGRGAVVIHDLSRLEGRYANGQVADITYRGGIGKDRLQGPKQGLSGGQER